MPRVPEAYTTARRQTILDAASIVFARRGIQGATMAEIAQEAGLTPGALYRYFAGKDDLAASCYGANASALEQQWYAPLAPGASPLDDFERLARLTFSLLDEPECPADTALYAERLLDLHREADSAGKDQLRATHERVITGVRSRLAAARDAGQVAPEIDTAALADALSSFYWGLRIQRLYQPSVDWRRQFDQILRLLHRSATPDPPKVSP